MIAGASCQAAFLVQKILGLYAIVLMLYALASWVPSIRGRWTAYLARFIEPVLLPIRRVIPPVGGFDIAFLLLFLFVQWLSGAIVHFSCVWY